LLLYTIVRLRVTMKSSHIYADIAMFTSTYTSSVYIPVRRLDVKASKLRRWECMWSTTEGRSILRKHSIHYRNRVLCRVFKTLGKGYFMLGKKHSANISSAKGSLSSVFFFGHSAKTFPSVKKHLGKTLPSVKKHLAKKNTRQIKNRKN
jgi:hypothetical protein